MEVSANQPIHAADRGWSSALLGFGARLADGDPLGSRHPLQFGVFCAGWSV